MIAAILLPFVPFFLVVAFVLWDGWRPWSLLKAWWAAIVSGLHGEVD